MKTKCGQDVDGEKKKLPRKDEQDRKKWKQDGKNLLIEISMSSEDNRETSKFVWSNYGFHFSRIVVCSTAEPRRFLHRKCCVVRLRGQEGLHHPTVKLWAHFHRKRPTAWPQSWTIRLYGQGHHMTSRHIHWIRKASIELRISTSCRGCNACELAHQSTAELSSSAHFAEGALVRKGRQQLWHAFTLSVHLRKDFPFIQKMV